MPVHGFNKQPKMRFGHSANIYIRMAATRGEGHHHLSPSDSQVIATCSQMSLNGVPRLPFTLHPWTHGFSSRRNQTRGSATVFSCSSSVWAKRNGMTRTATCWIGSRADDKITSITLSEKPNPHTFHPKSV